MAVGVVSTAAYGVYYWGLVNGDVSRFVPALAIETTFVLLLGFPVLGEAFPPGVYAGVGLVVAGALSLSRLAPTLLSERFDPFTPVQKGSASVIVLLGCAPIQFSYV